MSTATGELLSFRDATVYTRSVGEGRPLLLVNGLGAHTQMWRALETALPGTRIVEFDLPGAGQSPLPRQPVRMGRLARLCVAIMDHFGLEQPDVVGYSMGGMVAQQLAATYPDRVRRLVLCATTPGVGSVQADPRALFNIMTPIRYANTRLFTRSFPSLVGGRARHDPAWIAEQAKVRFAHRPSWRGYLGQLNSMAGWTALPLLPRITHPALVLAGDDDPLTPVANGRIIASLLKQGRLLVLPDEGHLMIPDERSGSHPAIRDFLAAEDPFTSEPWRRAEEVSVADARAALAGAPRQLPPLCVFDAAARHRWLRDTRPTLSRTTEIGA